MTIVKYLTLFIPIALPGGCLLHPPYDKAAVVLYNQTADQITYSVYTAEQVFESANIKSQDADFVMVYDIISDDETPPVVFNKIRITTPGCLFELDRNALENYFVRDPEGRKGWNLYINNALLKKAGCEHQ
jgi:hypothetical protein